MKKLVKCTSCGITLEVPQKNGQPYKDFRCPNCSHQLRVVFSDPQAEDDAGTVYGGGQQQKVRKEDPSDDGRTVLATANVAKRAFLRYDSKSYVLRNGQNTVGRQAASSEATVQIATDDHYMSRYHAIIKLSRIANGSLKALISNHKNKHATIVGGQEVLDGDELVLTNGISIRMGNTTVVYFEE